MKTADEFLSGGAEIFKQRNSVYGNNYLNVGKCFVGLFPEGVQLKTADDFNRFHIFMLAVVKLTRYANNWSVGGHLDSSDDAMVYMAMLSSIDEEIKERDDQPVGYASKQPKEEPFFSPPVTDAIWWGSYDGELWHQLSGTGNEGYTHYKQSVDDPSIDLFRGR